MALVEIPPYVLSGDPPPAASGWERAFHTPSYYMPPVVEFPRELFTDPLAEHARILDAHLDAILTAPIDGGRDRGDGVGYAGPRNVSGIHATCTLLVTDGAALELHKWRLAEASYVVQRCHGIARRLLLEAQEMTTYVVVVARDVASLHLMRGIEPKRAGDGERLEVAERDLVVEPWDQWHWRTKSAVYTWWRTPVGELVASRAPWIVRPRKWDQVVDALVALYEPEVRRGIARHARENPRRRALAVICTSTRGDEVRVVDRFDGGTWLEGFPQTRRAVEKGRPGFDPVLVDGYFTSGLRWLPRGDTRDYIVPDGMSEARVEDDDEEGVEG